MRLLLVFILLVVFAFHYTDTAHFEVEVAPGTSFATYRKDFTLDSFVEKTISENFIEANVNPMSEVLTDSHRYKLLGIDPCNVPEGRFDPTMYNYILTDKGEDVAVIFSSLYSLSGRVDTVWIKQESEFPLVTGELTFDEKIQWDYILKWKDLAIKEEKRTGIPAGIKLAQGILESNSGQSYLAREANNHFGIKCFSRDCKPGHCVNRHDDHPTDMFKVFRSTKESFIGNSKVLEKKRYSNLFKIKKQGGKWTEKQLQDWADGLKQYGYATSKTYNKKLKRIIKKYNLHEL